MSRAPRNDRSIPLSAALGNNIGIIDFIDAPMAGLQTAAAAVPPGMVVGGPPAYLEAHGIRYVPASVLGAETASASAEAPESAPEPLESVDAEPTYVSQQELEARVDDRIRRFMNRAPSSRPESARTVSGGPSKGEPVRTVSGGPSKGEPVRTASIASRAEDVRVRLQKLRGECSDAGLSSSAARVLRSGRRIPNLDYDF